MISDVQLETPNAKPETSVPLTKRYSFRALRDRLGCDGVPMAERTARRKLKLIGHINTGRVCVTEGAVQEYERRFGRQ